MSDFQEVACGTLRAATSASVGKADRYIKSAPRSRKLFGCKHSRTADPDAQYFSATSSEVVVLIGASSVPPCFTNFSSTVMFLIPRHKYLLARLELPESSGYCSLLRDL